MASLRSRLAITTCAVVFALRLSATAAELQPVALQDAADPSTPPTPALLDAPQGNLADEPQETAPDCDAEVMAKLNKAVAGAYKPLFYDNDFSYLCDPCYCDWFPGQRFKRVDLHDCCWILDVGGQYRARYQSENNIRGLGLTGQSDDFLLHRTRVYGNLEIGSRFRAYVEYIDAVSNFEDDAPRPIEENRSDLLNAFGEMLIWDDGCHSLRTRVGRQELLYGAQRAVSPLDWANTRRTFQGYKAMYHGHGWEVDGFWTNPVIPDAKNFDSATNDEEFMGV